MSKTLKKSLVEDYLDWADQATSQLLRVVRLPKPSASLAIAEAPVFDNQQNEERFVSAALHGGYAYTNLSLLKYEQGLYQPTFLKKIRNVLPIKSAHGSSIKREIKTGDPYRKFLIKDLELLRSLHLKDACAVNFDLYAGQPAGFRLNKTFSTTQKKNLKALSERLGVGKKDTPEFGLIEKVISDVASVFRDTEFGIMFEVPGSKGWSMFPEISETHLEYISQLISTYLPRAKLCIDVGHVVTWDGTPSGIKKYLNTLDSYKQLIGMFHISSAGSNTPAFEKMHRSVYGKNAPLWHVRGLDLALSVCEKNQIDFIGSLRGLCSRGQIYEVSENRTPTEAMKDYFGQFDLSFINDSSYFMNLYKQGKILGYA